MLDHNNLEAFSDPVNYDRADDSDTGVAFYAELARETGGPILEVACGTGRVTIPIARMGVSITGLDIVPGMLDQARRKSDGLPVRWVDADARTFDLNTRFKLIFMTGNAFQAFVTNEEQTALLQRVHAHLDDEGLFAFETRNPLLPGVTTREGLFVRLETRTAEDTWPSYTNVDGRVVHVSTTQRYDHVAQVVHLTGYERWHDGTHPQTRVTRTALRYTFPQELAALLHANGFTRLHEYGDWDKSPLRIDSPSIISVCKKSRSQ